MVAAPAVRTATASKVFFIIVRFFKLLNKIVCYAGYSFNEGVNRFSEIVPLKRVKKENGTMENGKKINFNIC